MEKREYKETKFYTQHEAIVDGRHISLYLSETPVCDLFFLEWESSAMGLEKEILDVDYQKAEAAFYDKVIEIAKEQKERAAE